MAWLAPVALAILHALYRLVLIYKSLASRFHKDPRPLAATRSALPFHLALSLIPDSAEDDETNEKYMLNSVEKVAAWCQVVGIRRLTVYDREGVLSNCSMDIRKRVLPSQGEDAEESPVECDIRYPLTPPPSDDADSRPLSPLSQSHIAKLCVTTIRLPTNTPKPKRRASVTRNAIKRRRVTRHDEKVEQSPLTIHVVSYRSGKPAVAAAATAIMQGMQDSKDAVSMLPETFPRGASIQDLNAILEGENGLPSPDLMMVHRRPSAGLLRSPVELAGFPPWQLRLTEIYWGPYLPTTSRAMPRLQPSSIDELEFRRALDEFACAEMRLGK